MSEAPAPRLRRSVGRSAVDARHVLVAVLCVVGVVAAWWFVLAQATGPLPTPATVLGRTAAFIGNLLGAATDAPPAYAQLERWVDMSGLVFDTLVMSVLAMGLAGAGALVSIGSASRLMMVGDVGTRRQVLGRAVLLLTRGTHAVLRSVPELIWAMLIVFVLRPGILAGAIALALHELGVLGRLGSDVLDDLDPAPLRSLRSAGAGSPQLLMYGALPQVLPQLVTYLLYRWEIVIRATVVVGFITGAGLGHQLRLSLSFRRWTEVALVLLLYVLIVWVVEAIASWLRRLAR